MQTEQKGTKYVLLEGVMAKSLMSTDPDKYKKHIWYKNGKPKLYFRLKKALYGTLEAARLAWEKLT